MYTLWIYKWVSLNHFKKIAIAFLYGLGKGVFALHYNGVFALNHTEIFALHLHFFVLHYTRAGGLCLTLSPGVSNFATML